MNQLELIKLCFCILGVGVVFGDLLWMIFAPFAGASTTEIIRNSVSMAFTIVILLAFYQDELVEIWRMITKNYRR